ncbi:MAG: glycosyltransferase, partial [Anaerolineae bacterium]|nr:glycosyltransferase [Anaerolineae bacterium]MDW8300711.1 glycosyltransferase [Anaerolineae bacterium]
MSKRIAFIGAFSFDYPRNQILRVGLAEHGYEIISAPLPRGKSTLRSVLPLWQTMRRTSADFYLLAEFNAHLAPFAILMSKLLGRRLGIDYLVGLYDTYLHDRVTVSAQSLSARRYRLMDRWTIQHASLIFTDTQAHANFFETVAGESAKRMGAVPVGVYDAWWSPKVQPAGRPHDGLLIQFFGKYLPFHGVDVILEAAKRLESDAHLRFELIGRGQTFEAIQARAAQLGLSNVTFAAPVPASELPSLVARADICLGVFAAHPKTDYVVPNKVFQCMALGKPLITAQSKAVAAHFQAGEHFIAVQQGDPEALAAAICTLAESPELRAKVGQAAAQHIHQHFTPARVAEWLLPHLP